MKENCGLLRRTIIKIAQLTGVIAGKPAKKSESIPLLLHKKYVPSPKKAKARASSEMISA